MKKKSWIIIASVFLIFIVATVFAQIRVHRFYEDNFGIEKQYYTMAELVPFGDNATEKVVEMKGCFLRVDKAEILTGNDLLERVGQSEESVSALLGHDISPRSERLCVLTTTIVNDSEEDKSFDLGSFTLVGENYDVVLESEYTIIANRFLLDAHKNELDSLWGGLGLTGVHLNPGQEAEITMVFGFSKMDFSARKWDRLNTEPLWLQITYTPVAKYIELEFL